ncbi:MAG: lactate utilization protein [Helicobacteraceae bacterium]|jgi:L-lactate utilization protein LutB|nr:lactate utilization protein [Helicobacteraceae bacterium]
MEEKDNAISKKYELSAIKIIKSLKSRKFEAFYCKNKDEAVEKAMSLISEGSSVSWGGSVTIREIGLIDRIYKTDLTIINRDTAKTIDERFDLMRKALLSDVYLTSVNAISEDGIMVNVDGVGNRVAAMTFGPKSVIVIIGMNKVCKTSEDARVRARTYAAPVNAHRISINPLLKMPENTPCALTGMCFDCKTDECMCSYIIETRMCKIPGRIKVILVGESLGF